MFTLSEYYWYTVQKKDRAINKSQNRRNVQKLKSASTVSEGLRINALEMTRRAVATATDVYFTFSQQWLEQTLYNPYEK